MSRWLKANGPHLFGAMMIPVFMLGRNSCADFDYDL